MPVIECTMADGSEGYKIGNGPCIYDTKAKATAAFVAFLAQNDDDESLEKAEWTTAWINDLPDAAFAYIQSDGEKDENGLTKPRSLRHLPHHNASVENPNDDKSVDMAHLNNALARVMQTTSLTDAERDKAQAHLQGHKKRIAAVELAKIDLAEGESINDLDNKMRDAIRVVAKAGLLGEFADERPFDVGVRAIYNDHIIAYNWQEGDTRKRRINWTRGTDNTIVLDPSSIEEVEEITTYEPIDAMFEKEMISGKDDNEIWKVTDSEGSEGFYLLKNKTDISILRSIYSRAGRQDEADQQPNFEKANATPPANFEKMDKAKLFKADKKRGIFQAVVLSPYTIDVDEDWTSPMEIEKAIHVYMEKSQTIGKRHVEKAEAVLIECSQFPYPTIDDENAAKSDPQKPHKIFKLKRGKQAIHSGDWIMTVQAKSEALKKEMASGDIAAFSIGGSGIRKKIDSFNPMAIVTEVIEIGE